MKTILLIVFSILNFCFGYSQGYIGLNKKQSKRGLTEYNKKNNYSGNIFESGRTIEMSIRDPKLKPMDFLLQFDKSGKCEKETSIADCDTCLRRNLDHALQNAKYGWVKIGEDKYVSKYSKKLLLELIRTEKDYRLITKKMNWTRREYEKFVN